MPKQNMCTSSLQFPLFHHRSIFVPFSVNRYNIVMKTTPTNAPDILPLLFKGYLLLSGKSVGVNYDLLFSACCVASWYPAVFAKKILDENSYFLLSVYCTPLTSIKTSQRKMLTPSPPYLLFSLFGEKNVRQKVQLSRIVVILGICLSQKM